MLIIKGTAGNAETESGNGLADALNVHLLIDRQTVSTQTERRSVRQTDRRSVVVVVVVVVVVIIIISV